MSPEQKAEMTKAAYKSFVKMKPTGNFEKDLRALERLRLKMYAAYKVIGKVPPYKDGVLL